MPPFSLVYFIQLLYIHQGLKQFKMQDQIQMPYLPFPSLLDPHWDFCPYMFASGENKRNTSKTRQKIPIKVLSKLATLILPILLK